MREGSRKGVAQLAELALDLLLPRRCAGCGATGSFLCQRCLAAAPRHEPPFCLCCGGRVADGDICRNCRHGLRAFAGVRSAFVYTGPMAQAIQSLKYRGVRALAPLLARLLAEYLARSDITADVIVPVPLHKRRLRQRGYNQSELLARELARLSGLPLEHALVRIRNNPQQTRMASAEERRHNVEGAFAPAKELADRRALLVDDVCTTGATLDACAATLKAAGAASVWGLTFAREI